MSLTLDSQFRLAAGLGVAVALAACGPQAASPLRAALDAYDEASYKELADATDVVQPYVPLGSRLSDAQLTLASAGFGSAHKVRATDAQLSGYSSTADTYLSFELTASWILVMSTKYFVVLGVRDDVVVFLNAWIRVDSL